MSDPLFHVVDRDGRYVGQVAHVVAERGERRASGLVIQRNGNEIVLPLTEVAASDGRRIVLRAEAARYHDLPPFYRAGYRVIDEELAASMDIDEDFEIGGDGGDGGDEPYGTPDPDRQRALNARDAGGDGQEPDEHEGVDG